MYPFPSINQFRNVVSYVRQKAGFMGLDEAGEPMYNPAPKYPKLSFTGTVKLHGTNAAIVYSPNGTYYQSRQRVLTLEQDNAGFMAHMEQHKDAVIALGYYLGLVNNVDDLNHTIVVYGEWCGGNIQKGVAICKLPKMFVIFGITVDGEWTNLPQHINNSVDSIYSINHFKEFHIDIDFEHPEAAQVLLQKYTEEVEACCPVAKGFGVEGIGEGIVWRCATDTSPEYWFKVKGEKHSASKVKVLAEVDLTVVALIEDFVNMTVTEARLEQGLHNLVHEQLKPFAMTSMGDFIRWVQQDVLKEEADVLQANSIEYKKLGGPIALVAKRWFVEKLNESAMSK